MGCPSPPHRPRRSRLYRPRTTATWSWLTYGATWRACTAAPKTLSPPKGLCSGSPHRNTALPPMWSARRRQRRGRRPCVRQSPGKTVVPQRLQRRRAGSQGQPTAAPPDGIYTTIAEATAMRAPAEMAGWRTGGLTAPLGGIMSAGPMSVPPETEPPPLGATTTPPPGGMTAPAVTRSAPPPG